MLGKLYLLQNFNNYFNRKIIKKDNIQEYLEAVGNDGYFILNDTNFNPNDGVTTNHIIGDGFHPYNKDWVPDYALYVENNVIKSRWFIIEFIRSLEGQYNATFKRDTVTDSYFTVTGAPCYIEKATLAENDPFLINNEGIQFNQIKQPEMYLKDETKTPWVIAYLNQHERPFKQIKAEYSSYAVQDIEDVPELMALFPDIASKTTEYIVNRKIFDDNSFRMYWRFSYGCNDVLHIHRIKSDVTLHITPTGYDASRPKCWDDFFHYEDCYIANIVTPAGPWARGATGWNDMGTGMVPRPAVDISNDLCNNFKSNFNANIAPYYNAMGMFAHSTGYVTPDILKYIGRRFRCRTTGKYFTFSFKSTNCNDSRSGKEYYNTWMLNGLRSYATGKTWDVKDQTGNILNVSCDYKLEEFALKPCVGVSVKLDLLGTKQEEGHEKAFQTQLAPYDIIAFPAFNTTIKVDASTTKQVLGEVGINIARAISEILGTDNLYDIQILPFCPCRELINDSGIIDLTKSGTRQALPVLSDTGTATEEIMSYCIFCHSPFFNFEISKLSYDIDKPTEHNISDILTIENTKLQANTDMYRLNSPNYASSFEFNLAKCVPLTGGSFPAMTKFKVDCCYRPYNPYVHIAPDFAFLYGGDYNDARGLIFSGDFGLTTMNNAFTDYVVRNKNYQNIFDRQIQNMETNRQIAREQEQYALNKIGWEAFSAGLDIGQQDNWLAMATKGVQSIGNVIEHNIKLHKQKDWNERAFKEQRSFATDMFNMQMDNIKALPNTITHSAALTNNFKFFPVLEFYTCTDKEKEALEDKLKYNGMAVGRVGRIENYLSTTDERFVKGQIIRLNYLSENAQIANDIYNEVNKGLFFEPYIPSNRR